ncbi:hypothetical protein [Demequina aestuarii]|uniref:hypothetical protein n=1 Tax=Demequina aestuarii TaxID=327095 RepID=UPI000A7AEF7F|nr:hypothetical protein [Demequina aestuarii]
MTIRPSEDRHAAGTENATVARPDRTVLNILAAGTGGASLALAVVGAGAAIAAIVLGLMGVRASRRGQARLAWVGVAGILFGLLSIAVMLWLASTFANSIADLD